MRIAVHIDRLVLEGLPVSSAQGNAIGIAVEAELARFLTTKGLPVGSSRAEPHLRTSLTHLVREREPSSIGHQIGAAVYNVLNPSEQQTARQGPP